MEEQHLCSHYRIYTLPRLSISVDLLSSATYYRLITIDVLFEDQNAMIHLLARLRRFENINKQHPIIFQNAKISSCQAYYMH